MIKYAHVGQELLVQDAELRRLRRVVRAAERIAKQIDERMPVYSSDLCGLYSAVAAYRKGKAKRS